jgi:hypothetical protein
MRKFKGDSSQGNQTNTSLDYDQSEAKENDLSMNSYSD